MKQATLTSVIWKEHDAYVSKCPELGVASCGDSKEEAQENLKEAVELFLENAKALGMMDELQASLLADEHFTSELNVVLP